MNTITVNATKSYPAIIGSGLIAAIGRYIQNIHSPCCTAIISDSNVWSIYGPTVENSLRASGYDIFSYVFPAGEASKNTDTYFNILQFLAENHLTRSDLVIALGGGVTGDMAGFAAATYLRGVSYIQVPTSLLAMVDSSVGGKTAIDLPAGKNLVGAFYQPIAVLCDISVLQTLPDNVFRDGCAEVIKYGILYDELLFQHLISRGMDFDREYVISRCVELKRDVVAQDEFDTGARQKLNLGHTFGHGIEAKSNFSVTHGQAVATGMAIAARSACSVGICDENTVNSILLAIKLFGLPTQTYFTENDLFASALSDKKRAGNTVNLILPRRIGDCVIQKTPIDQLESLIKAGL